MQKIQLVGRLGRDAEIAQTSKGNKFLKFTLATNLRYAGSEETSWWDVIQFNYNEKLPQYLKKGSLIYVYGDIRVYNEVGKDGKTYLRKNVYASNIEFADGGKSSGNTNETVTVSSAKKKSVEEAEAEKVNMYASRDTAPVTNYVSAPQVEDDDDNDLPF